MNWLHPMILDKYIIKGFLKYFLLVLGAFVVIFVVFTFFELLNDIVDNQVPFVIVVNYFRYLLPQIIYFMFPMSVLVAVLGQLQYPDPHISDCRDESFRNQPVPVISLGHVGDRSDERLCLLDAGIYIAFRKPKTRCAQRPYQRTQSSDLSSAGPEMVDGRTRQDL